MDCSLVGAYGAPVRPCVKFYCANDRCAKTYGFSLVVESLMAEPARSRLYRRTIDLLLMHAGGRGVLWQSLLRAGCTVAHIDLLLMHATGRGVLWLSLLGAGCTVAHIDLLLMHAPGRGVLWLRLLGAGCTVARETVVPLLVVLWSCGVYCERSPEGMHGMMIRSCRLSVSKFIFRPRSHAPVCTSKEYQRCGCLLLVD